MIIINNNYTNQNNYPQINQNNYPQLNQNINDDSSSDEEKKNDLDEKYIIKN